MRHHHRLKIAFLIGISALIMVNGITFAQEESSQTTHTVAPGDTLYRIAQQYGVDVTTLAQVNNIANPSLIYRGQVLIIPGLTIPDDSAQVENPLIAGTPVVHVVQRGESLGAIATQYGTTVEQILQANTIANPNRIFPGQSLNIWVSPEVAQAVAPAPVVEQPVQPPPSTNISYTIQPGETLGIIAQRYGMSWTTLAQMNGIYDPNHVVVGQTILIPALNGDGGIYDMGIITGVYDAQAPAPSITSGKLIMVDLSDSKVYAYQDGILVRSVLVSTGLPATPTVQGQFTIRTRVRSQRMSGPGYDLPNVEWVMYFYQGYALHGAYWHSNWGRQMSHGCVNMPNNEAQWFYENFGEVGTPVHVQA
jgi:LysM repeat protein